MPPHPHPPITLAQYSVLETYFRTAPGDWGGAARASGVDHRTAKKAWCGPVWRHGELAGLPPLREKFALEDQQRRQREADLEAASRNTALEELEKAKKLEEEAKHVDAAIVRLARNDVLGGLRSLGMMREGIEKLCRRLGDALETGVDASGKPMPLDPIQTMKIVASYAHASKQLVEATNTLNGMVRLEKELPTAILGLEVLTATTLEDAEREVELAGVAIKRAKELGLVALQGGKSTGKKAG